MPTRPRRPGARAMFALLVLAAGCAGQRRAVPVNRTTGRQNLALLARSPQKLLDIVGVKDRAELDVRWNEYLRGACQGD